jgi:signal transduction histidine kinase
MAVGPKLSRPVSHRHQLEQDLEHITQEMYRRNKELADTNRTLSLLRTIDNLVLESRDSIKVLAAQISSAIAATTEYPLVAIYGVSSLGTDKLEPYGVSVSGMTMDDTLLSHIKPTIKHQWYHSHDRGQLVSLAHVTSKELAYYLGCPSEVAEKLLESPIRSAYLSKLVTRQKLTGVLVVGSNEPASGFGVPDLNLLERLAEAVGIALDNKLLFEENQRVLQQLKKANSRLKELDQTKDEFISMASHQLRTPLTSIKGYLSMVLEGDVGEVKKSQQKMIQQAFDSAEQMVFLISDLLNVSRLQSGKFVIENKPTDMVKLVTSEVDRLKETAKNHGVGLACEVSDGFPTLNLDENKIRQVVMNFIDNAIYYTPSGGNIDVKLEATNSEVIYTVTDTGLGVPKAVQHKLFSKFYRADNARKVRPDGTGLGLFMAKKVIVAQGGSIIFKSAEGKGSTFGFSFPRKSVEINS